VRLRMAVSIGIVWVLGTLSALAQDAYRVELTQVDDADYPRISLYLSVTDAAGEPVGGLVKESFRVLEDDQAVPILDFAGIGEPRPVDIVFVFDTTGSMSEEIEGVKERCIAFADQLQSKGRDYRLGLVTFWDQIKGVYRPDGTLTDDVRQFKGWIETLEAKGGDDGPELSLDALVRGSEMRFRDRAQRVLILITDAPPHHRDDSSGFSEMTIDETLQKLEGAHITLFAVAPDLSALPEEDDSRAGLPGRYGLPARNEYGRMTDALGGKFYNIDREPDFTGIIDEIGGLIASQYQITYESARPAHDGTRRGIVVKVGESGSSGSGEASGGYLEKHLINIRSRWLAGLAFLIPLLIALVVPPLWSRARPARPATTPPPPAQPAPAARPVPAPKPAPTSPAQGPHPGTASCPRCNGPLRAGARFCGHCGYTLGSPPQPTVPQTAVCPTCGQGLRPGARFCGNCGSKL
jgi:VWFA-related protein